MPFAHVDDYPVTAPRELYRLDAVGRDGQMAWPDVGGDPVETTYRVWRCTHCRAMACSVVGADAPSRCGKCGLR